MCEPRGCDRRAASSRTDRRRGRLDRGARPWARPTTPLGEFGMRIMLALARMERRRMSEAGSTRRPALCVRRSSDGQPGVRRRRSRTRHSARSSASRGMRRVPGATRHVSDGTARPRAEVADDGTLVLTVEAGDRPTSPTSVVPARAERHASATPATRLVPVAPGLRASTQRRRRPGPPAGVDQTRSGRTGRTAP